MEKLVRNIMVANYLKEKLQDIKEKTPAGAWTKHEEFITNIELEVIEDFIKEFGLKYK